MTRLAEDEAAVLRFKDLTERILPARAQVERWPIRLDHCFKRICLDWAFGDVWYRHLQRPAELHLSGTALRDAVQCAETIMEEGLPALQQRDAASLRWRGKPAKRIRGAS